MHKITFICLLLLQWSIYSSVDGLGLTYFHCRTATCQDFHYGLRDFPYPKIYANVCHKTIHSLQNIQSKYGRCYDEMAKKLNLHCIQELAKTMRMCVEGLVEVPEQHAKYYCGYRLMQNCARHVGLERFPYQADYRYPQLQ